MINKSEELSFGPKSLDSMGLDVEFYKKIYLEEIGHLKVFNNSFLLNKETKTNKLKHMNTILVVHAGESKHKYNDNPVFYAKNKNHMINIAIPKRTSND